MRRWTCETKERWEDNRCEGKFVCETADQCTAGANGQVCLNGGAAAGVTGDCRCDCGDGFSGSHCETAGTTTTSAAVSSTTAPVIDTTDSTTAVYTTTVSTSTADTASVVASTEPSTTSTVIVVGKQTTLPYTNNTTSATAVAVTTTVAPDVTTEAESEESAMKSSKGSGLAVGISVGILVVAATLYFFISKYRRREEHVQIPSVAYMNQLYESSGNPRQMLHGSSAGAAGGVAVHHAVPLEDAFVENSITVVGTLGKGSRLLTNQHHDRDSVGDRRKGAAGSDASALYAVPFEDEAQEVGAANGVHLASHQNYDGYEAVVVRQNAASAPSNGAAGLNAAAIYAVPFDGETSAVSEASVYYSAEPVPGVRARADTFC